MTDKQLNDLWSMYTGYMGNMPSNLRGQLAMQPASEVQKILENTKNKVQSDAVSQAQENIAKLGQNMGGMTGDYLQKIGQGWDSISQATGLKGAQEQLENSQQFLDSINQRGPMFEQTMRGGLEGMSPTFLGANRDNVEQYFSFIPNVRVRQEMISNYLNASQTSMTNVLKGLKGLYDTAALTAKNAVEADQKKYNQVMDLTKDLWTELAWANRAQFEKTLNPPTPKEVPGEKGTAYDSIIQEALDGGANPAEAALATIKRLENTELISLTAEEREKIANRAMVLANQTQTTPAPIAETTISKPQVAGFTSEGEFLGGTTEYMGARNKSEKEKATKKYFNITGGNVSNAKTSDLVDFYLSL